MTRLSDLSTQRFISELIRAANEVDKLTKRERENLLRRAAATIHGLRDQINYSETPANSRGRGDVVFDLNEMAQFVDDKGDEEIKMALLNGLGTIKAGLILLDEKHKIERGEE